MSLEGKSLNECGWIVAMEANKVEDSNSIVVEIGLVPRLGFKAFLKRLVWLFWIRGDRGVRIAMTVTPVETPSGPAKKVYPS